MHAGQVSMTSEENDLTPAAAPKRFGRIDMFFCILCALSAFLAVAHFTDVGRGRAAALCAGVDFAVLKLRWGPRGNLGLLCSASLILLVQVIVIAFVPFGSESMPVYGLVPAGVVVYLVDECIIFLLRKGFGTRPK